MTGCVLAGSTWYSRHQLSANVKFKACFACCSARWHSAKGCCQLEKMANDADGANKGMSLVTTLVGWLLGAATMQQSKPPLQMLLSSFCVAAAAATRCSLMRFVCSCFPAGIPGTELRFKLCMTQVSAQYQAYSEFYTNRLLIQNKSTILCWISMYFRHNTRTLHAFADVMTSLDHSEMAARLAPEPEPEPDLGPQAEVEGRHAAELRCHQQVLPEQLPEAAH